MHLENQNSSSHAPPTENVRCSFNLIEAHQCLCKMHTIMIMKETLMRTAPKVRQAKLALSEQRQYDEATYLKVYLSGIHRELPIMREEDLKLILQHIEYLVKQSEIQHLISGFEIMNDIVLDLKKRVKNGEIVKYPKAYMRMMAKYKIIDNKRRLLPPEPSNSRNPGKKPLRSRIYHSKIPLESYPDDNIYEIVDDRNITAVQTWLNELSEIDRVLVTLVHMRGCNSTQAAHILQEQGLGCFTPPSLRKRLSRLLQEARKRFPQ
jgi:DNA-directed RNA polymerase specialized sigma24 family protein